MIADSLSVTLLLISLPCLPVFQLRSFNHLSRRSPFFQSLSICLPFSTPPNNLLSVISSSSLRSTSPVLQLNCFTFSSILSFFLLRSPIVPLHSSEAWQGSLQPSNAKNVPPRRPSSSHTNNTSRNMHVISSFIDDTKAAMVL